jgi:hypothetical protein
MRRVGLGRETAGATDGLHVTFRQRTKHFGFFNMRMIDGFCHWADDTHAQLCAFNGGGVESKLAGMSPIMTAPGETIFQDKPTDLPDLRFAIVGDSLS